MARILLFSTLFLASIATVMGQSLEFDVSPVVVMGITADDVDVEGHSFLTNNLDVDRDLRWERNIVSITSGWGTAVCDYQCYSPQVGARDMNLAASSSLEMILHVYPEGVEGGAVIELNFTDNQDPDVALSNIWYFNEQVSSTTEVDKVSVKVYPNPSNGLFSVKGYKQIGKVEVFSLTGQRVKDFNYFDGQWYDITDLPTGSYLIRILDRDGQQVVTKLMNKY